ncbi:unnamed protein product [Rhodiola kirilowii]
MSTLTLISGSAASSPLDMAGAVSSSFSHYVSSHHCHHTATATAAAFSQRSHSSTITAPLYFTSSFLSRRIVACQVALRSESESESAADEEAVSKVGSRVRVKVDLKVFHVPKVAEIDLTGKEGVIKQYVGVWKGKRISANFPYKVEFHAEVPERGVVKFAAHLREDELEFLG